MSAADRLTLQANLYDLETLELCTVTTQAGSSGRQHAATCATFDVSLSRKMQSSIGACKIGTGSAAGASSGSSAEEKSESVSTRSLTSGRHTWTSSDSVGATDDKGRDTGLSITGLPPPLIMGMTGLNP